MTTSRRSCPLTHIIAIVPSLLRVGHMSGCPDCGHSHTTAATTLHLYISYRYCCCHCCFLPSSSFFSFPACLLYFCRRSSPNTVIRAVVHCDALSLILIGSEACAPPFGVAMMSCAITVSSQSSLSVVLLVCSGPCTPPLMPAHCFVHEVTRWVVFVVALVPSFLL